MKLLDFSFRVKLPIMGALLIIISAVGVSSSQMVAAYTALREDLRVNAEILGRALASSLVQDMLHDDVWRAYEKIRASARQAREADPGRSGLLLVVDRNLDVFVSSDPKIAPVLIPLRTLGPFYAMLADAIPGAGRHETQTIELPDSGNLYVMAPIADDRVRFGTLIIVLDRDHFLPSFYAIAWYGLIAALVVLALLLPINWYWGRRLALPLTQLTERIGDIGKRMPANINPELYRHGDELGRLFTVFNQMLAELRTKEEMEKQIVQSERLAALGQLSAAMAHEINNPLGGMLTAIDTLKCHADIDPLTMKTIDLIERGLTQIKETVGALLVEARMKSRDLCRQDIDDVITLIVPQAHKKALHVDVHNALPNDLPLPATLVRQILINLLLNAVEAAAQEGHIGGRIEMIDGELHLQIANDGRMPAPEEVPHLFEPFFSQREGGHGLGLWVTYQIVQQLGGRIRASIENRRMIFTVELPAEAPHG